MNQQGTFDESKHTRDVGGKFSEGAQPDAPSPSGVPTGFRSVLAEPSGTEKSGRNTLAAAAAKLAHAYSEHRASARERRGTLERQRREVHELRATAWLRGMNR